MKKKLEHEAMSQFLTVDNNLEIGGITVSQLATRVGQTPFYAYVRELMTSRVKQLKSTLPKNIHLHYAIKANPMPAVVHHMAGLTDGLDVASHGELLTALDTGVNSERISFAGPGKTDVELKAALASYVVINIESAGELERIASIAEILGIKPIVAVRVNPDFELKTSGMKMGGGAKPFGIDAEQVPTILQRIAELQLDFKGFHIFSGSQNLRPEAIIEAQTKTFELAYRLAEHTSLPVAQLNIGGGFGIPYFPGEKRLDIEPIAENLDKLVAESASRLTDTDIVLELGRYLVGEAGVYVCEVVDRKESRGETFVITNGGLHHHLSLSGNFGQVIRKNYPVAIGNKMGDSQIHEVTSIVGPLCTPLDILADNMSLPRSGPGDLVVVFQSGAYGFTASPHHFLSHPMIKEVLI